MGHGKYSAAEVCQKGDAIYQQKLNSGFVQEEKRKYVAVDIETEQIAFGDDRLTVGDPIRENHPDAAIYVRGVVETSTARMGWAGTYLKVGPTPNVE